MQTWLSEKCVFQNVPVKSGSTMKKALLFFFSLARHGMKYFALPCLFVAFFFDFRIEMDFNIQNGDQ
ncbi:Circadian clock oscillator protein KaiC [Trichinella pseudospiralis]